jgi:glycosyltransferase involved in cell wall biosynthesis
MTGVRRERPNADVHLLALAPGPLLDRAATAGFATTTLPMPDTLASLGDSQFNQARGSVHKVWSMLTQAFASGSAGWRYLRSLRETIRSVRPDLIHSNGIKTHCLAWLASPRNIPIIWHVHDFFSARPMANKLLRLASRRLTSAIAISHAVARDLQTACITAPTHVVPNGIDVGEFAPGAPDGDLLDRLAGFKPDASVLRIGLVATYAHWKGHDIFLEAAAKLSQEMPGCPMRFYVIGGPIYQTRGSQFDLVELQKMAHELGIIDQVGFIGFQREVAPFYRSLDVVVHASKAPEPFGLTIVEAMACGKAVVATMAGGVVEIIRPGHDALGVPPGNAEAMADALRVLVEDRELRLRLGANARQTVCERFDQNRLGGQVLSIYEEHWKA